ncbi:sensor histidine kinase [Streptomyces sp. NPDC003247]|uniref:sensor histidine kinase n=1 Tax=Streptomyces sp. NPDC003247 TaxID=3364677 RepID=UPI0036C8277F
MKRRLSTVRARLTALYAALFVATSTAVLIAVDLLAQRLFEHKAGSLAAARPDTPGATASAGPPAVPAGQGSSGAGLPDHPTTAAGDAQIAVESYHWLLIWVAVAVLAVVGAAVGWWLAGRVLRPVHRITATARRLSLSDLHERIALTGPPDELRELADTFDAMLERLERAADSQRRFAANASHELRTPLAIQRAAIEIGLDDPTPAQLARTRAELLRSNVRTERLIEGLLALAEGRHGPERREPVDLRDLAHEVADQHRGAADEAGVTLDRVLQPTLVLGDPVLLTRLIANLVHNAIRHNHPGGSVRIRTSPAAGLSVSNTGPRIPADRVPELFEPFRRLHPPRTGPAQGAGLGLSIVAAVADAHQARVDARPRPGGGLTVTVTLPRCPSRDGAARRAAPDRPAHDTTPRTGRRSTDFADTATGPPSGRRTG